MDPSQDECLDDPFFTSLPLYLFVILYVLLAIGILTMFYLHYKEARQVVEVSTRLTSVESFDRSQYTFVDSFIKRLKEQDRIHRSGSVISRATHKGGKGDQSITSFQNILGEESRIAPHPHHSITNDLIQEDLITLDEYGGQQNYRKTGHLGESVLTAALNQPESIE